MQVSRPKTSSKETPAQVFSCAFCAIFRKTLFTKHLRMIFPADFSIPTKVLFTDHIFFSPCIFFFTFYITYQKLTWTLLRQLHLGNNLTTRVKENTNCPVLRRFSKSASACKVNKLGRPAKKRKLKVVQMRMGNLWLE